MPTVTQIKGEPMRFMVSSESGHKPYLVDLSEYEGDGACDCPHFLMRVGKARRDGKKQWCKHIRKAFGYFGWTMARSIAADAKGRRK